MTAEEVLARLEERAGTHIPMETDGVLSGDVARPVKKIGVAWRATVDCVRRASAGGCDLLLTREPLYWQDKAKRAEGAMRGTVPSLEKSLGYKAKQEFLSQQKLTIARTYGIWEGSALHSLTGLLHTLAILQPLPVEVPNVVNTPKAAVGMVKQSSLGDLVASFRAKTAARSIRVLGSRDASIAKVAVLPGYLTVPDIMALAKTPGLDAVITGDACEWESFEYAEDWITAGHGKALIMLGLSNSLDPGAAEFSKWVQAAVPEAAVSYLPVGDPMIPIHTEVPSW